ncbi:glycosyltransferase family 2 protein [Chryseobacterium taklimakanense]|uniref:glycosyltransferase family 2 protein n=1 Tax=Chryseobacterium taklimakanense TaxID=536441 RepID=UPI000F5F3306|nr:glycosyltransferase family 2 protein [Chryseobacterium taklimakanense]AZI21924.1 glycosyltransferase family 2 protein [Chryseobacterium taklimakanense]
MMNISVIIPVYNAEKYIKKAVASVLQFQEVTEVLLIDDGSKDKSLEICSSLSQNHPEIKVLTHSNNQNRGVSASRNLGIENATQEFITFLDADDYWLPNRFDAERVIFKDPKVDGVFGALSTEFISEQGKAEYLNKFGDHGLTTVKFAAEGKEIFHNLVAEPNTFGSFFSLIALTIRKTAVSNPTLRLSPQLTIGEDKEFIIRLAYHKHLKTGIIDKPVANRTAHESNSITKIKNYSVSHFTHNAKLYKSLYLWSIKQNELSMETKKFFKLKYLSNLIAATQGLKKYLIFLRHLSSNLQLLKTRYRYYALQQHK